MARSRIQKFIEDDYTPTPTDKKWFDVDVNPDHVRTNFFAEGCSNQLNQPYVNFKNHLLHNKELLQNIRSVSLLNFSNKENVDVFGVSKFVHFSEHFFLEIRGVNVVGYSPDTPDLVTDVDGLLTYHVCDPETGRKFYVGHSIIHAVTGNDTNFLTVHMSRDWWILLNDSIKMVRGSKLFFGKTFSDIANSIYKRAAGLKVTTSIITHDTATVKGTNEYRKRLVDDVNVICKPLGGVIQLIKLNPILEL